MSFSPAVGEDKDWDDLKHVDPNRKINKKSLKTINRKSLPRVSII